MLSPALIKAQFTEWDLSRMIEHIIREQHSNREIYDFRDLAVDLKCGIHANFNTLSDTSDLFSDERTRNYLEGSATGDNSFKGLTVTWLPQSDGAPQEAIRTLLGAKQANRKLNEMIVMGQCAPEDLDYATERLRAARKAARV